MKKKIVRITTIPLSLKVLLKGQLRYMSNYYEIVAISSPEPILEKVASEEEVRTKAVLLTRKITPIKDFVSIIKLYLILRKEKPFIVHTHTPKAGLVGMIAARLAGIKHRLHTVAGMPLLESSGVRRKILLLVEWFTYRFATRIYPNSYVLSDIITSELRLCKKDKVKIIGNGSSNGIDTEYFKPLNKRELDSFKLNLNISNNDFVFSFVGRVVKDKGINELVDAFYKLNSIHSNTKLLLVGPYENGLDPINKNTKIRIDSCESIVHTGFIEDIRPYLAISDLFVFPSYREGFPNVVMQAGSMGIPSIVTNINGCNEIIENGINGLIIPSKDSDSLYKAMLELYQNNEKRNKMASVTREMIATKYEQQLVWNSLLKEYQSLEKYV